MITFMFWTHFYDAIYPFFVEGNFCVPTGETPSAADTTFNIKNQKWKGERKVDPKPNNSVLNKNYIVGSNAGLTHSRNTWKLTPLF